MLPYTRPLAPLRLLATPTMATAVASISPNHQTTRIPCPLTQDDASVVAVDLSQRSLALAASKAKAMGVQNIEWLVAYLWAAAIARVPTPTEMSGSRPSSLAIEGVRREPKRTHAMQNVTSVTVFLQPLIAATSTCWHALPPPSQPGCMEIFWISHRRNGVRALARSLPPHRTAVLIAAAVCFCARLSCRAL